MPLTFQDGFTKDSVTGQVIGVGDLTGGGIPASSNGNPNITLPGGQIISGSDPNYGAYAAQQATMSGSQLTSSQIPIGGYVPGGNRSALPTTITNYQIPSALPDIKTASSLNPNELKESQNTNSLLKAQNDALKAQQANDKAGGLKQTVMDTFNKNPNGIANNAFIQAVAQAAYNRPATADELQKGGQFGLQGLSISEVVRRFGLAPEKPGATEYPPTQVDPAPEIATDDGLIDLQKAIADFESKLVAAQNEEIQAQANLDSFTNETMRGTAAIGDQLGRTATLVQGEQWSLKQQRQADEDLLVKRLGLAEKKKSNVIETGRLKMEIEQKIYDRKRQIVEDARKLRKDQQDILASSFEMMLKYGIGADKNGNFSPSTLKLVNDFSASTGIPAGNYFDMLNAAFDDKLNNNIEMIKTNKGRNNYITRIDKTTGKIISETFIGSDPTPAGGGGGGDPFKDVYLPNGRKYTDYQDDLAKSIAIVSADNNQWGTEWNLLKQTYGVPADILDADLGKDQFYPKGNSQSQGFSSYKTKVTNWWAKQAEKKRQGKSILSK